ASTASTLRAQERREIARVVPICSATLRRARASLAIAAQALSIACTTRRPEAADRAARDVRARQAAWRGRAGSIPAGTPAIYRPFGRQSPFRAPGRFNL